MVEEVNHLEELLVMVKVN